MYIGCIATLSTASLCPENVCFGGPLGKKFSVSSLLAVVFFITLTDLSYSLNTAFSCSSWRIFLFNDTVVTHFLARMFGCSDGALLVTCEGHSSLNVSEVFSNPWFTKYS